MSTSHAPRGWHAERNGHFERAILVSHGANPIKDDQLVCPKCNSAACFDVRTDIQHGFDFDLFIEYSGCTACRCLFAWFHEVS